MKYRRDIRNLRIRTFKKLETHLVLTTDIQVDEEAETSYTDGCRIVLSKHHLKDDIFMHEILHMLLEHVQRGKRLNVFQKGNKVTWNIACDIVVDTLISDILNMENRWQSLISLLKIKEFNAEKIYKKLLKNQKAKDTAYKLFSKGLGEDINIQSHDNSGDASNDDYKITGQTSREVMRAVKKAIGSSQYKKYSELEFTNASANFVNELKQYIQTLNGYNDVTFMKMSRLDLLGLSQVKMPKRISHSLEEPWFIIDTSGSITDEEYAHFISCIKNEKLLKESNILIVDTDIREEIKLKDLSVATVLKYRKYAGGTKFTSAFAYLEKKAKYVIVFTDLLVKEPPRPRFKVIWCALIDNFRHMKYGKALPILT